MVAVRLGMQHAAGIAQAVDRILPQQVSVDARHLRGDVGTHTHQAAGELVHQLEGLEIQIRPRSGKQRIQILDHGRNDQLVAARTKLVEQGAAQAFHLPRLGRQHVFKMFGQQPGAHGGIHLKSISNNTPPAMETAPMKRN